MDIYRNMNYSLIADEFTAKLPFWNELEGFATDAIIRDAMGRLTEFWSFWTQLAKEDGKQPIATFVANYIDTVKRLFSYSSLTERTMWDVWGEKLRALEVGP